MTRSTIRPNFFLVGAAKAGTTTLWSFLNSHEQIYLSPVKEPNFFGSDLGEVLSPQDRKRLSPVDVEKYLQQRSFPRQHHAYVTREEDYLKLFRDSNGEPVIGEASTSYLLSCRAAKELRRFAPDAKILIILRNPFDRALSAYRMEVKIGRVSAPFEACILAEYEKSRATQHGEPSVFGASRYFDQVTRYLDVFGLERVHIELFDALGDRAMLSRIAQFLEIQDSFPCDGLPTENAGTDPRFGGLNRLLYRTGIKGWIQKKVPRQLKKIGKSVFYRPAATVGAPMFPRVVTDAFNEDIDRLGRYGLNVAHWRR